MGSIIKGLFVKENQGHILRIPQGKPQKKFETKKLFELKKNFRYQLVGGRGEGLNIFFHLLLFFSLTIKYIILYQGFFFLKENNENIVLYC